MRKQRFWSEFLDQCPRIVEKDDYDTERSQEKHHCFVMVKAAYSVVISFACGKQHVDEQGDKYHRRHSPHKRRDEMIGYPVLGHQKYKDCDASDKEITTNVAVAIFYDDFYVACHVSFPPVEQR
jgi:hypothetical protein